MSSPRILIVEDQREVSRLLRSALETLQRSMKISECPSGEEALLEAFSGSIDLLVTDYLLPGMNGIELMGKIRKSCPAVKTILITGLADPMVRTIVAEAGADASYLKPIPMADFLNSVERLLGYEAGNHPPEPEKTTPKKEIQVDLPNFLAGLRRDLAVSVVYIINENGTVLGRSGDLPDTGDEEAILSLLPSIHTKGLEIARLLGQDQPDNIQIFRGKKLDLITIPASQKYSMVFIGAGLANDNWRNKYEETITAACRQVTDLLGDMEKGKSAVEEPAITPHEPILSAGQEGEPLFLEGGSKIPSTEVNEFWDKAAENHKGATASDRLTYEQAKKLGIAPEKK